MPRVTRTNGTPTGWFMRVPRSAFPRREAPAWPALDPSVMQAVTAPAPVLLLKLLPRPALAWVGPAPVLEPLQEPIAPGPETVLRRSLLGGG